MEKFHHVPGFVSVNGVKAVINKNREGRIVTTTKTIIDGIRADLKVRRRTDAKLLTLVFMAIYNF